MPRGRDRDAGSRLNPFAIPFLAAPSQEPSRVAETGSLWEGALTSARPCSTKPVLCPAIAELAAGFQD